MPATANTGGSVVGIYLALVAGFGWGYGWRAGAGERLRLRTSRAFAFELGGMYSYGRDRFFWGSNLQAELAMTFRLESGLQL